MPNSFDGPTIYIDGAWRSTDASFPVHNPATGATIGFAGDAPEQLVLEALDAASAAFPKWRAQTAESRGALLRATAQLLRERIEDLALLMTTENGKPLAEARGEIIGTARNLEWAAEEGRRAYGRVIPSTGERHGMVWTNPVGVVLAISPWNFPLSMLGRKVALALASGCTVIAKPAEETPLIARALMEVFHDAGLPGGALNMITTSRPAEIVAVLLADSRIAKVSFTGSTEVGLHLQRSHGDTVRRMSLELGGHSPFIVLPDADLQIAAADAVEVKFKNAGQSCVALNRLFVHRDLAEEFTAAVIERVRTLVVGSGLDPATTVGPLIDGSALDKVERHVQDAREHGAEIVVGGARCSPTGFEDGPFFEPTVVTGVTDDMLMAREETFGPVLAILTFTDEEEVVARANSSRYGLAAYVYGRDVASLWRVASALDFGVIGLNDPVPIMPELPFGGMKNSGQEREGGTEGIEAYLESKAVSLRI